jgi:prepilin peptidase CpaA
MSAFYENFLYAVFGIYVLGFLASGVSDIWRFIIPNWLVVALTVLFFATAAVLPFNIYWQGHLGAAAVFLAFGLLSFRFGLLGAGDGKLVAVGALWVGWDLLPMYILYVSLTGAAFGIAVMMLRRVVAGVQYLAPASCTQKVALPRLLIPGEGIPYGVAIAVGAIAVGRTSPMFDLLW